MTTDMHQTIRTTGLQRVCCCARLSVYLQSVYRCALLSIYGSAFLSSHSFVLICPFRIRKGKHNLWMDLIHVLWTKDLSPLDRALDCFAMLQYVKRVLYIYTYWTTYSTRGESEKTNVGLLPCHHYVPIWSSAFIWLWGSAERNQWTVSHSQPSQSIMKISTVPDSHVSALL
jgi:hypothetical protein